MLEKKRSKNRNFDVSIRYRTFSLQNTDVEKINEIFESEPELIDFDYDFHPTINDMDNNVDIRTIMKRKNVEKILREIVNNHIKIIIYDLRFLKIRDTNDNYPVFGYTIIENPEKTRKHRRQKRRSYKVFIFYSNNSVVTLFHELHHIVVEENYVLFTKIVKEIVEKEIDSNQKNVVSHDSFEQIVSVVEEKIGDVFYRFFLNRNTTDEVEDEKTKLEDFWKKEIKKEIKSILKILF